MGLFENVIDNATLCQADNSEEKALLCKSDLRTINSILNNFKGELSVYWRSDEIKYIDTSIDNIISKNNSIMHKLDDLVDEIDNAKTALNKTKK